VALGAYGKLFEYIWVLGGGGGGWAPPPGGPLLLTKMGGGEKLREGGGRVPGGECLYFVGGVGGGGGSRRRDPMATFIYTYSGSSNTMSHLAQNVDGNRDCADARRQKREVADVEIRR